MNYFLTQYFVNKIKRNKMAIYNNETDPNVEMCNKMNEMYDKETLDGITKINGKRYDEKMIDRIADEMEIVREEYMVSQHNERNTDVTISRIMETLNRIESKVDKLVDALANV